MEELNKIFATNLINIRKKAKLTQAELATELNYSDKAVSKWERGDSIPDVKVLIQIASFFSITVDYLITSHEDEDIVIKINKQKEKKYILLNHVLIIGIAIISIWVLATIMFVIWYNKTPNHAWLCFIIPVPISLLVAFILSCIWLSRITRMILLSGFTWTTLTLIYLLINIYGSSSHWEIFLIGIPAQIVIALSYGVLKLPKFKKK